MATQFSQDGHPIAVTTSLGKDKLLLEKFTGVEAISRLFRFELTVLTLLPDSSFTGLAFDTLLGQSATVAVTPPELTARYFNGIINKVVEGHQVIGTRGITFLRYRLEIVPKVWMLTRTHQSRIFQQQSVPDILKVVLGTTDISYEIQGTFEPRDYCIQYRETDFAFASRLMEEEGIFYFFKHTSSGHTMVVANTAQSYPQVSGPTSISFDDLTRGVREDERIGTWVKTQVIRTGKETLWDYSFEMPDNNFESKQSIQESVAVGTVTHKMKVGNNDSTEFYDFPGAFAQRFDGVNSGGGDQAANLGKIPDDGTRTVGIRMQEEAAYGVIIDGQSDCRLLVPGHKFTFANHFNANGDYVVLEVNHSASVEGTYTAQDPVALIYENNFQCLPVALAYRPPCLTPKPKIDGTQTALVVGPSGEEIFTDKYSRVKVQFHWDRDGKKDAQSSCWIRVATLWAGKQWGIIHIPRIGQEVIVAFEEGDPDQPMIVGSVYNADNMPPYTLPDNKTQSGILTRSTLSGDDTTFNQLRFEDKKGSEEVYFHAEKDFTRIVQNNDVLQVGYEIKDGSHKSDDGSQTIKIYKDRTETLETGDETVTISKGKRTHTVQSDESLTVKEGNQTIAIQQGNRTESVDKGDETVTIGTGSRTHSVKTDDTLTVEGKQTITVTGNQTITVKQGNRSITISAGNDSTTVSAGTSTTEAAQSITLKVGGNSIVIDQSGITIKGIAITIEGQASLNAKSPMTEVDGDGMLTLKGGVVMVN